VANVAGLRTPGGIILFEFQPSIGILADRIERLAGEVDNFREPLVKSVQKVIIPSIRKNFKEEGRPAWQELSAVTVKRRGGDTGPILRRSGRLERTATQTSIWSFTNTAASIQKWPQETWYGALHQAGHGGQKAKPVKKASKKLGVVSAADIGGDGGTGTIPARPFIMYQPEDIPKIHDIFDEWLDRKIAQTWGRL
jgi:phage gpG-like protein